MRKTLIGILSVCAAWLPLAGTYQVLRQSLWADAGTTDYTCRAGASALYEALETARNGTNTLSLGEREAVSLFRTELGLVWQQSHAIVQRCQNDKDKVALRALRSLELLRYAEERSIRLSAVDLTKLRRSTPDLVRALSQ